MDNFFDTLMAIVNWIFPDSLVILGAMALILAPILVYVDVPNKGMPWDKVGAILALIGGFGLAGAATGWAGQMLDRARGVVEEDGAQLTSHLVGSGVVVAIIIAIALWAWSRIDRKGISARSKTRSLLVVGFLAVAGAAFTIIPGFWNLLNDLVSGAASILASF